MAFQGVHEGTSNAPALRGGLHGEQAELRGIATVWPLQKNAAVMRTGRRIVAGNEQFYSGVINEVTDSCCGDSAPRDAAVLRGPRARDSLPIGAIHDAFEYRGIGVDRRSDAPSRCS